MTETCEYDALGRETARTDGRGSRSQTVYDDRGRVAKTVDALGRETAYGYDALGRQTSVTDPLGNTVTTAYDAEGRVLSRRGATYPVDYTYDVYGSQTSMTSYRDENGIPDPVLVGGDVPGAPHVGETMCQSYEALAPRRALGLRPYGFLGVLDTFYKKC